jgi:hypothetical protein
MLPLSVPTALFVMPSPAPSATRCSPHRAPLPPATLCALTPLPPPRPPPPPLLPLPLLSTSIACWSMAARLLAGCARGRAAPPSAARPPSRTSIALTLTPSASPAPILSLRSHPAALASWASASILSCCSSTARGARSSPRTSCRACKPSRRVSVPPRSTIAPCNPCATSSASAATER